MRDARIGNILAAGSDIGRGRSSRHQVLGVEDRCAVKASTREHKVTKLIAVDAEATNSSIRTSALALEDGEHTADRLTKPSHGRLGSGLLIGYGRRFVSSVEISLGVSVEVSGFEWHSIIC
jgi:hypothetical protein